MSEKLQCPFFKTECLKENCAIYIKNKHYADENGCSFKKIADELDKGVNCYIHNE